MLIHRIALTLGISIVALLISIVLDILLAPLPPLFQFLIQVPALVIILDEFRRHAIGEAPRYGLTTEDVNGAFFLAAPLAAFGATTLFADIRRLMRLPNL